MHEEAERSRQRALIAEKEAAAAQANARAAEAEAEVHETRAKLHDQGTQPGHTAPQAQQPTSHQQGSKRSEQAPRVVHQESSAHPTPELRDPEQRPQR